MPARCDGKTHERDLKKLCKMKVGRLERRNKKIFTFLFVVQCFRFAENNLILFRIWIFFLFGWSNVCAKEGGNCQSKRVRETSVMLFSCLFRLVCLISLFEALLGGSGRYLFSIRQHPRLHPLPSPCQLPRNPSRVQPNPHEPR